ncbi:MAG TPA: hypothetical protein VJV05_01035 [Pyrinomonadaceae bacterium]|nr:hypothetical protein [Pyrinomonadaceae bacterium]
MFCPNCAALNDASQHFCRMCGLNLDAIAAELTVQNPSEEVAALLNKKKWMELLGKSALAISGIIALCLLLTIAVYYKLILLGPEILFGSAVIALVAFLLASILFFAYSKFYLKIERAVPPTPDRSELTVPTSKLLEDRLFEPASVTEQSTELLTPVRDSKR